MIIAVDVRLIMFMTPHEYVRILTAAECQSVREAADLICLQSVVGLPWEIRDADVVAGQEREGEKGRER